MCLPRLTFCVKGDEHAARAKLAPSSEHWNVEPGSSDEKSNVAVRFLRLALRRLGDLGLGRVGVGAEVGGDRGSAAVARAVSGGVTAIPRGASCTARDVAGALAASAPLAGDAELEDIVVAARVRDVRVVAVGGQRDPPCVAFPFPPWRASSAESVPLAAMSYWDDEMALAQPLTT